MDLYSLPPLDMHIVSLPRDQQPTPRMLLGIALVAVLGLTLSWLPGSAGPASLDRSQVQIASNAPASPQR